jgi:hypothetical protein
MWFKMHTITAAMRFSAGFCFLHKQESRLRDEPASLLEQEFPVSWMY